MTIEMDAEMFDLWQERLKESNEKYSYLLKQLEKENRWRETIKGALSEIMSRHT